jgi:HSP20 family protein
VKGEQSWCSVLTLSVTLSRQLLDGDTLDVNQIQATHEQGVLTLVIPVAEQAKPHKVAISVNGNERVPVGAAAGS